MKFDHDDEEKEREEEEEEAGYFTGSGNRCKRRD